MSEHRHKIKQLERISENAEGAETEPEPSYARDARKTEAHCQHEIGIAKTLYDKATHYETHAPASVRIGKLKRASNLFKRHDVQKWAAKSNGWIARLEALCLWRDARKVGGEKERQIRMQSVNKTMHAIKCFTAAGDWKNRKYDETTKEKHLGVIDCHKGFYESAKRHFNEALKLAEQNPKDENSVIWCQASLYEVEARELSSLNKYDENKLDYRSAPEIAIKFEKAENGFKQAKDVQNERECRAWKSLFHWLSHPAPQNLHYYDTFREWFRLERLFEDGIYGRKRIKLVFDKISERSLRNLAEEAEKAEIFRKWHVIIKHFELWLREQRQALLKASACDRIFYKALVRSGSLDMLAPLLETESKVLMREQLKWAVSVELRYKHIREITPSESLEFNRLSDEERALYEEVYSKKDIVTKDLQTEILDFKNRFAAWLGTRIEPKKP